MRQIELNNGKIISIKSTESIRKKLIEIMDDTSTKLGYIPSREEAKTCPWMPRDLNLFDKYCTSYRTAMKDVSRRRRNRSLWRRATKEEVEDIEKKMNTKLKQREHRYSYLEKNPYIETFFSSKSGDEAKEVIKMPEDITKGSTGVTTSKQQSTDKLKEVLRNFASNNLRWPTDKEINNMRAQGIAGWCSSFECNRRLGSRITWPDQLFPEGLPDGFKVGRVYNVRPKVSAVLAQETIDEPKTPQSIFGAAMNELIAVLNHAGGGSVELRLDIRLNGEESPTEMHLALRI